MKNLYRVVAHTKSGGVLLGAPTCIEPESVEAFVVGLSDAIGNNNKTVYFLLDDGDWIVIPIENIASIVVQKVGEECEPEVAYQEDYPECDCGQSADEWHAAGCPALRREQR